MTDDKQDEVMEWLSQEHCWARSDARERINDTVNIIRAQKDRIAELEAALQHVKGRMVHSRCPRCTDNHEVAIAALQDGSE